MKRLGCHCVPKRLRSEDGQALVEFGLIATFLLLPLIAGVIQFGTGIAYWHDLNRLANQSARWASVDSWPGCPPTEPACTVVPPTCDVNGDGQADDVIARISLPSYIRCQATARGLRASLNITICSPLSATAPAPTAGDPVTVRLRSRWRFVPIVGFPAINLDGTATMRLDLHPTKFTVPKC